MVPGRSWVRMPSVPLAKGTSAGLNSRGSDTGLVAGDTRSVVVKRSQWED